MTTIYTIGYEGAALSDFVATLTGAGVMRVLDVRELPQSRRPGFSKRMLTAALEEAGISYTHTKQLGDPKHGREAARRGDMETFRAIFEAHLDLPQSQAALRTAADLVSKEPTVLLCYERDPKCCHRSLVTKRMQALGSFAVKHLGVQSHAAINRKSVGSAAVGIARPSAG